MKKNLWCRLGLHKWIYSNESHVFPENQIGNYEGETIYRECERCHKKQELTDDGQASGMASTIEWKTIRS